MSAFFDADGETVLATVVLNTAGLVAVLLGYQVAGGFKGLFELAARGRPSARSERFWIWTFAAVGVPTFFLLRVPSAFGSFSVSVPESVMILATFYVGALALLAGAIVRGNSRMVLPFLVLFAGHAVGSLLMFSKLEYLLLCLGILLGVYRVRPTMTSLVTGIGVLAVVYVLSLPFVDFGRESARSHGSAESRAAAAGHFLSGARFEEPDSGIQTWWTRLCYVPVQAFVMKEYDSGHPGGTFDTLAYAFIPRLLWPEKPAVSQGDRLTFLVNGSTTSMSSPTVIGESYWAGGWTLVAIAGLFVGVLQRFAREFVVPGIESGNAGPVAFGLVMVRMGLRPDDYFVSTWIASLPVLILFLLLVRAFGSMRWPRPHPSAARRLIARESPRSMELR